MRLRRLRYIVTAACSALMVGLMATPAHAAPGDRTISATDNETWLATNQCSQANGNFLSIGGAPQTPGTLLIRVSAGGEGNCQARIRMVYVPTWNDRKALVTAYLVQTRSSNEKGFNPGPGLRCYVKFGVRRKDGTFFTRTMVSPMPPPHCPKPDSPAGEIGSGLGI